MKTEAYLIVHKDNPRIRGVRLAENTDLSCTDSRCNYLPLVLGEQPGQLTHEDIHGLPFPRPALLVRWLEGHEAGQFTVEADTELEDFDGDEGWRGYYKEEDVQALHRRVREGMTQAASLERTVARLQALLKLRTEQLKTLGG